MRKTIGFVVALGLSGVAFAGAPVGAGEMKAVEAGEKQALTVRRGDTVWTFGGKSVTEHRFQKNAVMLNKCLPDETSHFRETVDLDLGFAYGEKKFGHKAIELGTDLRFKTIWGKIGHQARTETNDEFKVVDAALGEHCHAITRPLVWIKNAWIKASLNAVFDIESEKVHTVKLGMFPFQLGRGIAFGPFYGLVSPSFLAIYSRDTDYSAPGILINGEIVKDTLWYDLYYAKFEDKSATFSDVFNSNKEKVLGRRRTPWSGVAKDSDVFAARLKFKPLEDEKYGTLELEPYVMYNEASDQKVEMNADSKSMLGAVGAGLEYARKNFEFGAEAAVNYGHERLFAIDRNRVVLKNEKYGTEPLESVREVYSHVTYVKNPDATTQYNGKNVVVGTDTETSLINNRNAQCGSSYNDKVWAPSEAGALIGGAVDSFKNAADRYRCSYKNNYRGWMFVADASYLIDCIDLKAAAAYGFASGDKNPHATECDKNYKGFVGLYELYSGKRVPSIFILDARKIRRPLTLDQNETEAQSDPSFTDMHHFGFGLTWEPKRWEENNFKINSNLLFFWKEHESNKYDCSLNEGEGGVSECLKARKFMGTEFNLITQYDILKDLSIKSFFAVFFPGSYYEDIKGVPLKGDVFNKLEEADKADLPSSKYRLGDDVAYYAQAVLEYKF
ncbi:hypothetical protein KKA53_02070 [Candidatus Dependentiae bacterium]|nr:hypothetical protein [Candidatus Dependentiae bacterium]